MWFRSFNVFGLLFAYYWFVVVIILSLLTLIISNFFLANDIFSLITLGITFSQNVVIKSQSMSWISWPEREKVIFL